MSEDTAISWCDSTFNPWIGCTKVSPACDHCYAEVRMDKRFHRVRWGAGQPRKRTAASTWETPMHWQKQHEAFAATYGRRRRVFCASLADWLDNEVPIGWLVDLLDLIRGTPHLDWLLLTKRIGNCDKRLVDATRALIHTSEGERPGALDLCEWICDWLDGSNSPANVWLGATICSQEEADRDIHKLLAVAARVRFLSIEPMLGPVDLTRIPMGDTCASECCRTWRLDVLKGASYCGETERDPREESDEAESRIDWVICGGESGPQARPMHPDWVRSLRDQCAAAGVPFHFKQWGEWAPTFSAPDRQAWFVEKAHRWPIEPNEPSGGVWSYRIGTKAAGRLLDGVEHNRWPA